MIVKHNAFKELKKKRDTFRSFTEAADNNLVPDDMESGLGRLVQRKLRGPRVLGKSWGDTPRPQGRLVK